MVRITFINLPCAADNLACFAVAVETSVLVVTHVGSHLAAVVLVTEHIALVVVL
jgi:hypothetical protein